MCSGKYQKQINELCEGDLDDKEEATDSGGVTEVPSKPLCDRCWHPSNERRACRNCRKMICPGCFASEHECFDCYFWPDEGWIPRRLQIKSYMKDAQSINSLILRYKVDDTAKAALTCRHFFENLLSKNGKDAKKNCTQGSAKGKIVSLLMMLRVNVVSADSYSEVMFYVPVNISDYKLLVIIVLSISLSFICGMMCVGCCWWRFGAATKQTGAAVEPPGVVVSAQRPTSSRAMQTQELLAMTGKSPYIWCTPHGEKFHNTQSCNGLRNAKSTRKYERCLVCG